uniref:Uncharacterized protein n=1 Tax=Arundo donax TaxID=35708 RepID=A0A0A9H2H7_ARUDO
MSTGGTCSLPPTHKARLACFLSNLTVSLAHRRKRSWSKGPSGFDTGIPRPSTSPVIQNSCQTIRPNTLQK